LSPFPCITPLSCLDINFSILRLAISSKENPISDAEAER